MKFPHAIIHLTAIAGSLALNSAALQAGSASSELSMKPLSGISFDIGAQRAVAYFTSDAGRCKVVLTTAAAPLSSDRFTASRFEAAVVAGKATRFNSDGQQVEFACAPDAQSMTAKIMQLVADIDEK